MKWFIQIKVADLPINQYFKFLLAMVDTLAQELKPVIAWDSGSQKSPGSGWWHNLTSTDSDSVGLGWGAASALLTSTTIILMDTKIEKSLAYGLLLVKIAYGLYSLWKWKGKKIT